MHTYNGHRTRIIHKNPKYNKNKTSYLNKRGSNSLSSWLYQISYGKVGRQKNHRTVVHGSVLSHMIFRILSMRLLQTRGRARKGGGGLGLVDATILSVDWRIQTKLTDFGRRGFYSRICWQLSLFKYNNVPLPFKQLKRASTQEGNRRGLHPGLRELWRHLSENSNLRGWNIYGTRVPDVVAFTTVLVPSKTSMSYNNRRYSSSLVVLYWS